MSQISFAPTSIKLPIALKERVQFLADTRNRSLHSLLISAIETYVDKEEQREKLRQDAIKAHDEYMLTGLHVNNNEVVDWLEALAEGREVELPKCHL